MKTYKGLRAEESLFPVRGRALPSRLAAAATIALAVLVTFMLIATSCSVAKL